MDDFCILVVEDEPIVAEDIAERLEELGYCVTAIVESGQEAIDAARNYHPHLVLMDIHLEGDMDGVEAAHVILKTLRIPVVYLTANADDHTLQRIKATVPFGYILKPFREKELKATIEMAIARYQAETETYAALNSGDFPRPQTVQRNASYLARASQQLQPSLLTVRTATRLIQEQGHEMSEGKQSQSLTHIETAVSSMYRLTDDILILSNLDNPQLCYHPAPLNLVSVCSNAIEALQWTIENRYQVRFVREAESLEGMVDERLFWHLLNHLLSNAIHYSPEGSTIHLRITHQDGYIWLEIQDQGVGIPLPEQAFVFEPFYRASNVQDIPGSGLGLAIVQRVVALHQGTVSINSQLGQGTTIKVCFPMQSIPSP
ncbi:MAG: ATP-binding protein [Leptolyngbyaceae cyanobacterium bins.59]|nr:ATP-binding protein [Leptolyngbyaceae cyanobacterium bins.59]